MLKPISPSFLEQVGSQSPQALPSLFSISPEIQIICPGRPGIFRPEGNNQGALEAPWGVQGSRDTPSPCGKPGMGISLRLTEPVFPQICV